MACCSSPFPGDKELHVHEQSPRFVLRCGSWLAPSSLLRQRLPVKECGLPKDCFQSPQTALTHDRAEARSALRKAEAIAAAPPRRSVPEYGGL
jgi:hypothetical protein